MPMTQTIPILLDTDIGSDIDDALALAYLLRQPRCELVGISTVSGEPERNAPRWLMPSAGPGDAPMFPFTPEQPPPC